MKQLRVAMYLRVSTDEQTHDSQRVELEQYCGRRGWVNVRCFADTASGGQKNRAALDQLMSDVRRGRIDVVLTFKLDRLARSLNHLAQLLGELQTHNVAMVCPSQGIDTTETNPCAQLQLNILAAVAEFERELIRERVKAGLVAARARGAKMGRPQLAKRFRQQIYELHRSGAGPTEISRRLGIARSTISDVIQSERPSESPINAASGF